MIKMRFKTINDGRDTGEFEARTELEALRKVLGWNGIVVEKVKARK